VGKQLWRLLASVKVSVYVLFSVAFALAAGSFYLRWRPGAFPSLNELTLQQWWELHSSPDAWWLVALLVMLLLLFINTSACTLERLVALWSKRNEYSRHRFLVLLAPSMMHLFFLISLSGHALSLVDSIHQQVPIAAGRQIDCSGFSLEVGHLEAVFWNHPLVKHPLRQCTVALNIRTPSGTVEKEIRFLHPFRLGDWTFHLAANPKAPPTASPELSLILKKDPGVTLVLMGGALLALLLGWYFLQQIQTKKGSKPD